MTCTDFMHLALLTHKCCKSEKYYQVCKSRKSGYQVRMCFADGRQDGHARRGGPFSPVAISSGSAFGKKSSRLRLVFVDLVASIEPGWTFQKNEIVLPKSGSVRFFEDFREPGTGPMVRFRQMSEPWTGP